MNEQLPQQTPPDTPMDEFEVNGSGKSNSLKIHNKSSFTKTLIIFGGAGILLVTIIGIVVLALQNTNTANTVTSSPTAAPVVIQPSTAPTPQPDLPPEWQAVESEIKSLQNEIAQQNEDRSKISIPSINFETSLTD